MVTIIVDGKQTRGKEVIVKEWNSQAHKNLIYTFADEYDGADKMIKNIK